MVSEKIYLFTITIFCTQLIAITFND